MLRKEPIPQGVAGSQQGHPPPIPLDEDPYLENLIAKTALLIHGEIILEKMGNKPHALNVEVLSTLQIYAPSRQRLTKPESEDGENGRASDRKPVVGHPYSLGTVLHNHRISAR